MASDGKQRARNLQSYRTNVTAAGNRKPVRTPKKS